MWFKLRMMTVLQWFLVLSGVVLGATVIAFLIQLARDRSALEAAKTAAPVGAALFALIGLVVTITNLIANWRRQKRMDTIQAWNQWSDSTAEARRQLTTAMTRYAIPTDVGKALADDVPFSDGQYDVSDRALRHQVVNDLAKILNGLERLCVGVKTGVYDIRTLRLLGGTIILREWERGQSYVNGRRTATDVTRRQERAFVWLEAVANDLEREELRVASQDLDRRRIRNLRRNNR